MRRYYQPPRVEIQRVALKGLLLTGISGSLDGDNSIGNGGKTSEIDEEYNAFIHAGAKDRNLWDDSDEW